MSRKDCSHKFRLFLLTEHGILAVLAYDTSAIPKRMEIIANFKKD